MPVRLRAKLTNTANTAYCKTDSIVTMATSSMDLPLEGSPTLGAAELFQPLMLASLLLKRCSIVMLIRRVLTRWNIGFGLFGVVTGAAVWLALRWAYDAEAASPQVHAAN